MLFACKEKVELDYKIHPQSTYKIQTEVSSIVNKKKSKGKSEALLTAEDLSNVIVKNVSNTLSIDDQTPQEVKNLMDSTKIGVNYCKSIDSKTIRSDVNNLKNKETDDRTGAAINTWNSQSEFPEVAISIGENFTTKHKNSENTATIIRDYKFDEIKDQIAYLSFSEVLQYKNEYNNIQQIAAAVSKTGRLEYHIKDDYYRLIHTKSESNYSGLDLITESITKIEKLK